MADRALSKSLWHRCPNRTREAGGDQVVGFGVKREVQSPCLIAPAGPSSISPQNPSIGDNEQRLQPPELGALALQGDIYFALTIRRKTRHIKVFKQRRRPAKDGRAERFLQSDQRPGTAARISPIFFPRTSIKANLTLQIVYKCIHTHNTHRNHFRNPSILSSHLKKLAGLTPKSREILTKGYKLLFF